MVLGDKLGEVVTWADNLVTEIGFDLKGFSPSINSIINRFLQFFPYLLILLAVILVVFNIPSVKINNRKVLKSAKNEIICKENRKTYLFIFLTSFVFFLIAHLYAYTNSFYSHDSLLIYQHDTKWQIQLGRFLLPFLWMFRGHIAAPLLVGTFAFINVTLSSILIIKILKIQHWSSMFLITAIMETASTLTLLSATYLFCTDLFTLSLLFSVLSAYFILSDNKSYVMAVISLVLSLGLYQAYVQVTAVILIFSLIQRASENKETGKIVKDGFKYVGLLLLGLVIYAVCVKVCMHVFGITSSSSYNGLDNVGKYGSIGTILKEFAMTYFHFFYKLLDPRIYNPVAMAAVNVFFGVMLVIYIVQISRFYRISKKNCVLMIALIILMPFGFHFTYFISHGEFHDLMNYVNVFYYIILVVFLDKYKFCSIKKVVYGLLGLFIFNSVIYSNQAYITKDLEAQSTLSVMTRVADLMEKTEGFIPGETPVVLVGDINDSSLAKTDDHFIYAGVGMTDPYAATYAPDYYFRQVLRYPGQISSISNSAEYDDMAVFPAEGCTKWVDGTLYIKLGNGEEEQE